MSEEAFGDLKEALEEALAFERGERRDLNVTRIQAPRPPKAISLRDIAASDKSSTAHRRCLR